jgi:hypothetical protein
VGPRWAEFDRYPLWHMSFQNRFPAIFGRVFSASLRGLRQYKLSQSLDSNPDFAGAGRSAYWPLQPVS